MNLSGTTGTAGCARGQFVRRYQHGEFSNTLHQVHQAHTFILPCVNIEIAFLDRISAITNHLELWTLHCARLRLTACAWLNGQVNGVPWPVMTLTPRWYRFR